MALSIIPVLKWWSRARGPYGYLRTWKWPITAREISQPYNKYVVLAECEIWTASYGPSFFSFLLWPKREARGPWKQGRQKRESVTCCTDRANEANKMFIICLFLLFRFWKGDRELEVRSTATYEPGIEQSQHAKSVSHKIRNVIWNKKDFLFLTLYSTYSMNLSHCNFSLTGKTFTRKFAFLYSSTTVFGIKHNIEWTPESFSPFQ